MGKLRNLYRILIRKPEQKRPVGRSTDRWEDNTKLELTEFGWKGVGWFCLKKD
jgi:hypothetical protein